MSKDDFSKELSYQATMHIARDMLNKEIINVDEYTVINAIFIEKYSPVLGTLFSELT